MKSSNCDSIEIIFDGTLIRSGRVAAGQNTIELGPNTDQSASTPNKIDVVAVAIDSAGNVSDTSDVLLLEIDRTAPDQPNLPDLVDASDLGRINSDNIIETTFFNLDPFDSQEIKIQSNSLLHAIIMYDSLITNHNSSAAKYKLENLKYLIIDCLRLEKHPSHFNLKECIYVHHHLKPKKTILTNLHYTLDYNYLLKELPDDMVPAFDGLKINL